ncbi:alginate O-acetyltransferase AlgF [Deinococcus sonorensis]|uniref:Alginate biosynthesis protein AlgF n=2 Tax=Deinococcus sonorensis TaxID=309891 RepID=A0AAU7UCX4_9DEIO
MLVLASGTASAQDTTSLYAPAPPPNSAFVRLINATATAASGTIGSSAVTAAKAGVGTYQIIPQGAVSVHVGSVTQQVNVSAGKFYSLVWTGKTFRLMDDPNADNRAKALLVVYNLSSTPLIDLATADGKTRVLEGVAPMTSANRAVNGITVDLAVFNQNKALATFKKTQLERGSAYAIVVTENGATLTQSSTASMPK